MQAYVESSGTPERDEMLGDLLMEQDKLEQRLMASAEDTLAFANWMREITKLFEDLKSLQLDFESEALPFSRHIFKQITIISEQMRSMQDVATIEMKKIYADFGDLAKVTKLKEAYEQTLPEISRRRRPASSR